jgi:hypothetical protein
MSDFQLPRLSYPFAPAIHPHIEQLEQESVERWARKLGLHARHRGFKKLQHSRFAVLLGRSHPTSAKESLELIVDFAIWLFLWDDQFDNKINDKLVSSEWIRQQNAVATGILRGATPEFESAPLLWILADIRTRLAERMPVTWMERFIRHCEDYFAGTVRESEARHAGIHPDVEAYIQLRRQTSGVYMVVDLIELAEDIRLSEETMNHPLLQRMIDITNDVVGWSNDIFSLASDMQDEGHLNLVLSIHQHAQPKLQDALSVAAKMHDAELEHFQTLRQFCPSFGEEVSRFVNGLSLWMRANYDWSILTRRYTEPEAAPTIDMTSAVAGGTPQAAGENNQDASALVRSTTHVPPRDRSRRQRSSQRPACAVQVGSDHFTDSCMCR